MANEVFSTTVVECPGRKETKGLGFAPALDEPVQALVIVFKDGLQRCSCPYQTIDNRRCGAGPLPADAHPEFPYCAFEEDALK